MKLILTLLLVSLVIDVYSCEEIKRFEKRLNCMTSRDEKVMKCNFVKNLLSKKECLEKINGVKLEKHHGKIKLSKNYLSISTNIGCDGKENIIIDLQISEKNKKTLKILRYGGKFCEAAPPYPDIKIKLEKLGLNSGETISYNSKNFIIP